MYPSGPWSLKILMFALLVTREIATYSWPWEKTEDGKYPQCCSMSDLDFCWLSSQMPLEQKIDDNAKQMANRSWRRTWWCEVWTHVCRHCSCDDLRFNDMLTQSLNNQPRTIAQSYWLIEIAQQKDWHAHFEFQLMICDTPELQNV
jgi:hypothetical protein